MSRSSVIILFGVLTILTPFSGLPSSFRTFILVVFGAVLVVVGLMERLEQVRAAREKMSTVLEASSVHESTSKTSLTEAPHGVSPI